MPESFLSGVAKAAALHSAVFVILLGIFTLIAFWLPIQIPAIDVFKYLPVVFALYVGVYALMQWRRKKSRKVKA